MRVLGVIRLSRETDETTSPERQRKGITSWADAHGHVIVGWVEDLDVSGDKSPWDRPSFGPWLTDSPPADYDVIAGMKIDRISRRLAHFVQLIDWARARKKHVAAYMDSVDTSTKTGELMAKILAIFAEFERDAIAARSADSRKHARKNGLWHGGSVAYGYQPVRNPDGKGWKLGHDPGALPIVQEIISRVIDGESTAAIARDLNARGVLSPRDHAAARNGKPRLDSDGNPRKPQRWTDETLRRMIRSRALLGELEHAGTVVRGDDGLPVKRADPLVTYADWKQAQDVLNGKRRPKYRAAKGSMLSGVAFCECGSPLHFHWMVKRDRKQEYNYMRCGGRTRKGSDCRVKSIRAEVIEAAAVESFMALAGDVEVFERRFIPGEDHSGELAEVERAIEDAREEWDLGLYEGDRKGYLARLGRLQDRKRALEALPCKPDRWEDVPTGRTYRDAFSALETVEQRRLFLLGANGFRVILHAEPVRTRSLIPGGDGHEGSRVSIVLPSNLMGRVREHASRLT